MIISVYGIKLETGHPPVHFDSPWNLSLTQNSMFFDYSMKTICLIHVLLPM